MPRHVVLFDHDQHVAEWCWKQFDLFPMPFDMAIGIIDTRDENRLVGAAMFVNYNGINVELEYYGPSTPTSGIARTLAIVALARFNAVRVTIKTEISKRHIIDGMKKFGFESEGFERHLYGRGRHAVRLVLFRPGIERVAGEKWAVLESRLRETASSVIAKKSTVHSIPSVGNGKGAEHLGVTEAFKLEGQKVSLEGRTA